MALKGIIFDNDGTIIDSLPDQFFWLRHCGLNGGKTFKPGKFEYTEKEMFGRFKRNYNQIVKAHGMWGLYTHLIGLDVSPQEVKDEIWNMFDHWKKTSQNIEIIPGMEQLIVKLSPHFKLGLNTSAGQSALKPLEEVGLTDYFDTIVTRDTLVEITGSDKDARQKVKPDPFSINLTLQRLGLQPSEVIHIGDTVEDIQACKAAGIIPLGVIEKGYQDNQDLVDAGVKYVAHNASRVEEIINLMANDMA